MTDDADAAPRRVLDPVERISEILFGLIMVLTFTGSVSVAGGEQHDSRTMLISAIGCNFAWGIVDAVMYLMSSMTTQAHLLTRWRLLRTTSDPAAARRAIAETMPPVVASVISEGELEAIGTRLQALPVPPRRALISRDDWIGALGVFLLVFLSTFPVILPFLFVENARSALRISNGVAIVMLFACGYSIARFAGANAWLVGVAMVLLGTTLAALTMALGG